MATDPGTAAHVAERMSAAGQISLRKTFVKCAVFFQVKAVTLICDNRLSVKRTAGTVPFLPDPQIVPTYPGAKP